MKSYSLIICLFLSTLPYGYSQDKHDAQWIIGYDTSSLDTKGNVIQIDFLTKPPMVKGVETVSLFGIATLFLRYFGWLPWLQIKKYISLVEVATKACTSSISQIVLAISVSYNSMEFIYQPGTLRHYPISPTTATKLPMSIAIPPTQPCMSRHSKIKSMPSQTQQPKPLL